MGACPTGSAHLIYFKRDRVKDGGDTAVQGKGANVGAGQIILPCLSLPTQLLSYSEGEEMAAVAEFFFFSLQHCWQKCLGDCNCPNHLPAHSPSCHNDGRFVNPCIYADSDCIVEEQGGSILAEWSIINHLGMQLWERHKRSLVFLSVCV